MSLDRFVAAQAGGVYGQALAELQAGRKRSHWMWFVFPQLAGLGRSETARFYGIRDMAEARSYLAHPVLGPRLRACTESMLRHEGKSADAILGGIDALKLRSSATLFEAAGGGVLFADCLEAFYDGARDPLTLELLGERNP